MNQKIGIIGAGLAGLSSGYYLSMLGCYDITIFDIAVDKGASHAAAGMLCPIHESEFHESELSKAGSKSLELYSEWESFFGNNIEINRRGTLEIALTSNDVPHLKRQYQFLVNNNLSAEWITGEKLFDFEPLLSPKIQSAILAPNDIQINHRKLRKVLIKYLTDQNVQFEIGKNIDSIIRMDEKFILSSDEDKYEDFDKLLISTGVGAIKNWDFPFKIFPVKGQIICVNSDPSWSPATSIRIVNRTLGNGYIVPKSDTTYLGGTMEEKGFDGLPTVGAMMDITNRAYLAIPALYEASISEVSTGFRPATLDRMPVIDKDPDHEIYYINGLYRHGVLLSPLAGKAISVLIHENRRLDEILHFRIPKSETVIKS